MKNHEQEIINIEGELRQNLLRGLRRVRTAHNQGVHLYGAECIMELLGDPQLLLLKYQSTDLTLRIPVMYVSTWRLGPEDNVVQRVKSSLQSADRVLTFFRRRFADDDDSGIHQILVDTIQPYIVEFPAKSLLLDWLWAPRPEELDHDEIRSENWFAYHQARKNPDSIFKNVKDRLPSQLHSVDGLIRLSFPVNPEPDSGATEMITILLGLAFEAGGAGSPNLHSEEETSRITQLVRKLATTLISEIPQLYATVATRTPYYPHVEQPPVWAASVDRDPLHAAVDDLHRKVIGLAGRAGLPGWSEAKNGFNFVLAVRELDNDYRAKLRYCLSVYNLHAIGSLYDSDLAAWEEAFRRNISQCKDSMRGLFLRSHASNESSKALKKHEQYLTRCQEEIDELFALGTGFESVCRQLVQTVEDTRYPMRLTPGYWVMNLCHPEIITEWLKDPRAKDFDSYPEKLLIWEMAALPKNIYYSPIVDGAVPVGICGTNATIFQETIPVYELQELIDESAPRLRRVLANDELALLRSELRQRCEMLGAGQQSTGLWFPTLRSFRRLAYYYLPSPYDYHTKLIRDTDLEAFLKQSRWWRHGSRHWWELRGLSSEELALIRDTPHLGDATDWPDNQERDFFADFLRENKDALYPREMPISSLHRIAIREADGTSLLVLIPQSYHNDLAQDLIERFTEACDAVLSEYAVDVQRLAKVAPRADEDLSSGPFHVFLSYNSKDREFVEKIARGLVSRGIRPWFDQWAVRPGDSWYDKIEREIATIPAAAFFFGANGQGPWQIPELRALMINFVQRSGKTIPVIIDPTFTVNQLPELLRQFHAVDCIRSPDPIADLAEAVRAVLPLET